MLLFGGLTLFKSNASVRIYVYNCSLLCLDDNIRWASCKICWRQYWEVAFIPCGHASCKRCYTRLRNELCPFCREEIRKVVDIQLHYSLEYGGASAEAGLHDGDAMQSHNCAIVLKCIILLLVLLLVFLYSINCFV